MLNESSALLENVQISENIFVKRDKGVCMIDL